MIGRWAIALGLSLVVMSCSLGADVQTFSSADERIDVGVGDRFVIELGANPSIGNSWRLRSEPDPAVIRLVDKKGDFPGPPGAGGRQLFEFEATGPGVAELEIYDCYRCGSDDEPSPENASDAQSPQHFTVNVKE